MIYLKEDLTEEELKKAADLIVSTIPTRKEAGEKLVFKALQGSDYLVAAFKNNGYKIDTKTHVLYLNPYKLVEYIDDDLVLGHEHQMEQHDVAYMNAIFSRMGINEYKLHHLIFDSVEPTAHIAHFDKYKNLFPKQIEEKAKEQSVEPVEEGVTEEPKQEDANEEVNKNIPTEEEATIEENKEDGKVE